MRALADLARRHVITSRYAWPQSSRLHGVRVVEFTHMVMGPSCGLSFGVLFPFHGLEVGIRLGDALHAVGRELAAWLLI